MRKLTFLFILLAGMNVYAGDTLSLHKCYILTNKNFPTARKIEYTQDINQLKLKNISNNWYPTLGVNGQATYQSDVTSLNINLPFQGINIPVPPHEQYKIYLNMNQTIYDGGLINAQKKLEKKTGEVNVQQVEVDLYQLKSQVNQVYFTILLLDKNRDVLRIKYNEIKARRKSIQSGVNNGVILPDNLDVLDAEILNIEQQQAEIRANRDAMVHTLGELLGDTISDNVSLLFPPEINDTISQGSRPEYGLFDLQKQRLDAGYNVRKAADMPKLYAFGEAGYGKPGLNMFNNNFDSYYIAGVGLKWNFIDWGEKKRLRKITEFQKNTLDVTRQTFNKNLTIALEKENAGIKKNREAIERDRKIIALREKIRKSAASQLEHGVITSTEYLTELNAEVQARIQLEIHRVYLVQSMYNYLILKGDL
jgi:outer membrane protein TolC